MADMKRQMRLFEEGGIADDGMSVDPVSGNDIPPGSLAEEVRDDIPAQLSEGEYVVPADVLRYYGVRFFEDLRAEAKQGLAQMESNGRIGGEPVPAGGPQMEEGDLTPEEIAVLQEMGMNVGGYVPQQQPPEAVGNTTMQVGTAPAYAEGGLEDGVDRANITAPAFTPESLQKDYGLGFSIFGPSATESSTSAETTIVMLYSPDGQVRSLTLPTEQDEYDRLISEGWTTAQTEVTTETSVGEIERGGEGRGIDEVQDRDTTPIGQMDATQLAEAYNSRLSPEAKTTLSVIGALTGLPTGLIGFADKMSQKSIEAQAEKLGIDLSTVVKGEDLNRTNFVSDEAFNDAMSSVAPTGMSYDPDTGSYGRDGPGDMSPAEAASTPSAQATARAGIQAAIDARNGTGSTSSTSSSSGKGFMGSVSEALGNVAEALGFSNDNDNDNDSGTSGSASGNSGGGANAANDGPGRR